MLLRQQSLIHGQLHTRLPRSLAVLPDDALQLVDEALQVVLNLYAQGKEGRDGKTKQGLSRRRAWPTHVRLGAADAAAAGTRRVRHATKVRSLPAPGWAAPLLARGWACPPQCTAAPEQEME